MVVQLDVQFGWIVLVIVSYKYLLRWGGCIVLGASLVLDDTTCELKTSVVYEINIFTMA
jgi:hypothetical protein